MALLPGPPEVQRTAPSRRTRLENLVLGKLCSHEAPETPLGRELALWRLSFCEGELEGSMYFL